MSEHIEQGKGEVERGDRIYNGIPCQLMNDIYDNFSQRIEIAHIPDWATLSLYLCRACNVVEMNRKQAQEAITYMEALDKENLKRLKEGDSRPIEAQEASKISPHKLYEMAKGDSEEYKRLCIKHGYLIPKQTVLNRDELIKILESMNIVNGTILMKNVCDQADWIISVATSPDRVLTVKWPEKHNFEFTPVQYNQDWINGRNVGFNQAIDACKSAFEHWRKQNGC